MKKQKKLARIGMVVTTMIWGITFVMVKDALNDAGPYMFAFLRFGLAFLIGVIYSYKTLKLVSKKDIIAGLICGIVLFAGYAFQNFGLMNTSPSKSAFITSVSVILVPVLLVMFKLQKVNIQVWGATLLAVFGLYILLNPAGRGLNIGDILTFGCAFSFAVHIILQDKYLSKGINIIHFFVLQVMFVTFFSAIATVIFEGAIFYSTQRLFIAILVTGVLATFVAFLLMIWAQTILDANQTAILLSLEPVFAALFSTFFAGEILGFYGWVGGSIVVLAVIGSGLKKQKLQK